MGDFFNSKDLLLDGISKLKSSKIPNPEIDARILLSYAINYQNTIYMHNNISISKKDKNKFYCFLDHHLTFLKTHSKFIIQGLFLQSESGLLLIKKKPSLSICRSE